jgi:hypothetical protein
MIRATLNQYVPVTPDRDFNITVDLEPRAMEAT